MTLCVGLLSLSASDEDPTDWAFGWSHDLELFMFFNHSRFCQRPIFITLVLACRAGWLLIMFTTVAVSVPFGMILQLGFRLAMVVFYDEDLDLMPPWMQFTYTHFKEAAGVLTKLIDGGAGCVSLCSSSAGSTSAQTGDCFLPQWLSIHPTYD